LYGVLQKIIHPLIATTNSRVVANGEDASNLAADYYGVLQKIIRLSGTAGHVR
jgi:hypothetical protein